MAQPLQTRLAVYNGLESGPDDIHGAYLRTEGAAHGAGVVLRGESQGGKWLSKLLQNTSTAFHIFYAQH